MRTFLATRSDQIFLAQTEAEMILINSEGADVERAYEEFVRIMQECDCTKHHVGLKLGSLLKVIGRLKTADQLRGWYVRFT